MCQHAATMEQLTNEAVRGAFVSFRSCPSGPLALESRRRCFLGSVAQRVVGLASCPVMMVPGS